jgi:hypothetical protein
MYKHNHMEWKQNEIIFLKDNYHILGRAECVKILGRSKDSISSKISNLGLIIKSKNLWLDSEINFLKDNYQEFGSEHCAKKLNKTKKQIVSKANLIGLKTDVIVRFECNGKNLVNYKLFNEDFTKESVYILGLLWADGHIRPDKHLTTINVIKSDLDCVLPVFMKTGDWLYGEVKKSNNGVKMKTQLRINTTTWGLCDILVRFDFLNKSKASPQQMLSKIPDTLKKYWFRGYLDGDGCIKLGKKYGLNVVFAGSYEQDWSFMSNLCDELNINYSINRYVVKLGGYSHFSVRKKIDVKKLCDYIYGDYDGIGFSRKYKKYLDVLKYIDIKSKLFWSDKEVNLLIEKYKTIGGKKCAELLNKNLNSIYNKVSLLKRENML